jgi:uncharacterized protein YecE (DUF72 family)
MTVRIGTSGWQYADWRGRFYPSAAPERTWLEHYVSQFDCVEVNSTFYRLPAEGVFAGWAARAPDGFEYALKVSRYITHIRRLGEPAEPIRTFLERAAKLGGRLGPLLLQLPPRFAVDPGRLRDACAAVPATQRLAVEFRDPSWFREDVATILREHDAALCLTDRLGELREPPWATASWGYVRFHQAGPDDWSYSEPAMRTWAERLRSLWGPDADVYAFFNNDPGAAAIRDAALFGRICATSGLTVSRVPQPAAVYSISNVRP